MVLKGWPSSERKKEKKLEKKKKKSVGGDISRGPARRARKKGTRAGPNN